VLYELQQLGTPENCCCLSKKIMEHPSQMCEIFEQLATFNFNHAKFLKMFPQFYIILSNQTQLENLHKLSKILN